MAIEGEIHSHKKRRISFIHFALRGSQKGSHSSLEATRNNPNALPSTASQELKAINRTHTKGEFLLRHETDLVFGLFLTARDHRSLFHPASSPRHCFKASTCRPSHSWGCGVPEAESCPPSGFTRSISFQSLARKLIPTVTHLLKGNATADDPNTPTPRSGPPTRSPTCLRRLLFRSGKVTNQVGFVFCSPRGTEKN